MLLRSPARAGHHLWPLRQSRGLSSSSPSPSAAEGGDGKIVASVLFERLPVVIPKIHPVVYAFQEFSFRWRQQYRRQYPDDVLGKADARGKGDYQIDYVLAPRITKADKTNDWKSLQRALDNRLLSSPIWQILLGLMANQFGIFQRKYTKMKTLCDCLLSLR